MIPSFAEIQFTTDHVILGVGILLLLLLSFVGGKGGSPVIRYLLAAAAFGMTGYGLTGSLNIDFELNLLLGKVSGKATVGFALVIIGLLIIYQWEKSKVNDLQKRQDDLQQNEGKVTVDIAPNRTFSQMLKILATLDGKHIDDSKMTQAERDFLLPSGSFGPFVSVQTAIEQLGQLANGQIRPYQVSKTDIAYVLNPIGG